VKLTSELESLYETWLDETKIPLRCHPHLYNLSHHHQIVFLMHVPLERLGPQPPERRPVLPYIDACRDHLRTWLMENGDIWGQIARALPPSLAGATLANVQDLIENVYFTDCVKCEPKKTASGQIDQKDLKDHETHTAGCIRDEFALLQRAVLFITIGREAWHAIRDDLMPDLEPLPRVEWQHMRAEEPRTKSNVTDVHGVLFKSKNSNKFVIPLCFSRGQLRNSYLEYFREGLAALPMHKG
jgi:hypothetical protein